MSKKTAIVISGGPSVGKTTVIRALEEMDYPVLHEIRTQVIRKGEFSPTLHRDAFQKDIIRRQLNGEARLLKLNRTCFLDRGLLDGMAYYELSGLAIPTIYDDLDV